MTLFPNIIEIRLHESALLKAASFKLVEKLKLLQAVSLPPMASDVDLEWLCSIPQAAALLGVSIRGGIFFDVES